jgi:hypothetical protein
MTAGRRVMKDTVAGEEFSGNLLSHKVRKPQPKSTHQAGCGEAMKGATKGSVFHAALDIARIVHKDRIILAREDRRGDHEIRRRPIAGGRDVLQRGNPQQGLDVHVVGLWLHRVAKEDEHVNFAVDDHGAQLLIPAQRARLQLRDLHLPLRHFVSFLAGQSRQGLPWCRYRSVYGRAARSNSTRPIRYDPSSCCDGPRVQYASSFSCARFASTRRSNGRDPGSVGAALPEDTCVVPKRTGYGSHLSCPYDPGGSDPLGAARPWRSTKSARPPSATNARPTAKPAADTSHTDAQSEGFPSEKAPRSATPAGRMSARPTSTVSADSSTGIFGERSGTLIP